MLRILIVDDHEVLRRGVRRLVEDQPDWAVCAEASNGREAVERAAEHKPDVAVVDVSMPGMDGLKAAEEIRSASPNTEILMFTVNASEDLMRDALKAGIRGFLLKSDAGRHLVVGHAVEFTPGLALATAPPLLEEERDACLSALVPD